MIESNTNEKKDRGPFYLELVYALVFLFIYCCSFMFRLFLQIFIVSDEPSGLSIWIGFFVILLIYSTVYLIILFDSLSLKKNYKYIFWLTPLVYIGTIYLTNHLGYICLKTYKYCSMFVH